MPHSAQNPVSDQTDLATFNSIIWKRLHLSFEKILSAWIIPDQEKIEMR